MTDTIRAATRSTTQTVLRDIALRVVVAAASSGALAAQSTLTIFTPPPIVYPTDRFGVSLAAIGDVDNDGVQDYAVGSPQDVFWDPGRVSIMSGASGAAIRQVFGAFTGSEFGTALEAVGDVDSDGYTDLLALGPGNNAPTFRELRLFSARTGATLWNQYLYSGVNQSATALGGGEDVDGDAVPDFAADGFWNNVDRSVQVRSGASHALVYDIGAGAQDRSCGAFAMLGDLDGDQRSEIAYAAKAPNGDGVVHVVSGATGSVVRTFSPSPPVPSACFSRELVRLGDFDGDGVQDFAVTDSCAGRVFVVSGATAQSIRAHFDAAAGTSFGFALAGRGDFDHDGVADLLVGAPLAPDGGVGRGTVSAFSGRTGAELFKAHSGIDHRRAGYSLDNAGDVDGDGFADFAVGWPGVGPTGYAGTARLVSPIPLPPHAVGVPKVNSLGCTPELQWSGFASATSAQAFTITATQLVNQKNGTFLYGLGDPVSLPFQGGTMSAPAPRRRTPYQSSGGSATGADCTGAFSYDLNARIQSGIDPGLTVGARVVGQYWSRDPMSPSTTNLTSAVEALIGP